jgi:hypothetical protein
MGAARLSERALLLERFSSFTGCGFEPFIDGSLQRLGRRKIEFLAFIAESESDGLLAKRQQPNVFHFELK